jgi:hypothetical protein
MPINGTMMQEVSKSVLNVLTVFVHLIHRAVSTGPDAAAQVVWEAPAGEKIEVTEDRINTGRLSLLPQQNMLFKKHPECVFPTTASAALRPCRCRDAMIPQISGEDDLCS